MIIANTGSFKASKPHNALRQPVTINHTPEFLIVLILIFPQQAKTPETKEITAAINNIIAKLFMKVSLLNVQKNSSGRQASAASMLMINKKTND